MEKCTIIKNIILADTSLYDRLIIYPCNFPETPFLDFERLRYKVDIQFFLNLNLSGICEITTVFTFSLKTNLLLIRKF